eukprot:TRINITY_DN1824_c0_g1_i1.p1 TRINITY_DN1824_c0_g1~~TRINITY_DN1824_c0_g1_i1.p1  ORF type:complete len:421 (+),score=83.79 TRINITY_DN1824_c0_g1_i1:379-1641(+)
MMKKHGTEDPLKHDMSTLRLLASVGEPINEATWNWYFTYIGGGRCPIIDTWWQTETGSILINALPGIGPFIPGVAGRPFPGVRVVIISDQIAPVMIKEQGMLLLAPPYPPSMFRTIHNNDERYNEQFRIIGGGQKYFSNDGAIIFDEIGDIWLTGRIDDIMKVAGHALSNAELENALCKHPSVAEAAVVSYLDEIKMEVPLAFVILKEGEQGSPALEDSLKKKIDELIGPIARPEKTYFVGDLPKTRSGKILRRMLKDLVRMQPLGDVTTLMNPDSIQHIRTILGIPPSPHHGPKSPTKYVFSGLAIGPISSSIFFFKLSSKAGLPCSPSFKITKARGTSILISSKQETTAASATEGCLHRAFSNSAFDSAWPATFIISSILPVSQISPISSKIIAPSLEKYFCPPPIILNCSLYLSSLL